MEDAGVAEWRRGIGRTGGFRVNRIGSTSGVERNGGGRVRVDRSGVDSDAGVDRVGRSRVMVRMVRLRGWHGQFDASRSAIAFTQASRSRLSARPLKRITD